VGVENAPNVTKILRDAKEKYHLNPQLIVSDFSPNVLGPLIQEFGEEKIQIDGYHVMQELNRGIHADLLEFRERMFQAKIRELYTLREGINKIQAQYSQIKSFSKITLSAFNSLTTIYPESQLCKNFAQYVLKLVQISDYGDFQTCFTNLMNNSTYQTYTEIQEILRYLSEKLPKKDFTVKGLVRFKVLLLKQLKTLFVSFRKVLEETSIDFFHRHWCLYFQPERVTMDRQQMINELLKKYPNLMEYRQLTLQIGSIYRKKLEDISGNEIDSLESKPYYSEKLQTAIATLKKYKNCILRFVDVFKKDPTLKKRNRANMEYYNRRFKAPFNRGLNCTKKTHLLGKLKLQLNCEVRWLIDVPSGI